MDLRKRLSRELPEDSSTDTGGAPNDRHMEVQPSHGEPNRVPIRILERRIQSFTQTTVPHDLSRLRQHKENIIMYHKECNWTRLDVEQVNASRTVQQLKTHIQTIDDLRHQLDHADQAKFASLTQGVRRDVQKAIEEYGMVQSKLVGNQSNTEDCDDYLQFDQLASVSDQSVLIPREEAALQSWEELRNDLLELNELTRALHTGVKEQRQLVTQLEANVDAAAVNVQHAETQLQEGRRFRTYLLPVGGAIVGGVMGGVVGGPIGALAGLKVGALAFAAAGTAGAIGGAFVGYKAKEHNDQSMELDKKRK